MHELPYYQFTAILNRWLLWMYTTVSTISLFSLESLGIWVIKSTSRGRLIDHILHYWSASRSRKTRGDEITIKSQYKLYMRAVLRHLLIYCPLHVITMKHAFDSKNVLGITGGKQGACQWLFDFSLDVIAARLFCRRWFCPPFQAEECKLPVVWHSKQSFCLHASSFSMRQYRPNMHPAR